MASPLARGYPNWTPRACSLQPFRSSIACIPLYSIRLPMRWIVSLLLCLPLCLLGASSFADDDADLRADDREAIQQVILEQLDAFQRDDEVEAFSYAAPSIQAQFKTPDEFMRMVRSAYEAVDRPRSTRFLEAFVLNGQVMQPLEVVAPDTSGAGRASTSWSAKGDGTVAHIQWHARHLGRPDRVSAPQRVVVVGAGIAGLCCAYYLRRRGLDVVVLDAEPVGSRAASSWGNGGWIGPAQAGPLPEPGLTSTAFTRS